MKKTVRIQIWRAEGQRQEADLQDRDLWFRANIILLDWSRTAPRPGEGYDKCDFVVTWEDGKTYAGRYDLQRGLPDGDLAKHVTSFLRFYSGDFRPDWIAEEQYASLVNDAGMANECREFLKNYEVG